jgi:hypothetical protein
VVIALFWKFLAYSSTIHASNLSLVPVVRLVAFASLAQFAATRVKLSHGNTGTHPDRDSEHL